MRNNESATRNRRARHPPPRFAVSLTTCPGRGYSLLRSLHSLLGQKPADKQARGEPLSELVLVSAAKRFRRFGGANATAELTLAAAQAAPPPDRRSRPRRKGNGTQPSPRLEIIECSQDDGPGTKVLCVLPRLRRLAQRQLAMHAGVSPIAHGGSSPLYVVLADDDVQYKPWALSLLKSATLAGASTESSRDLHLTSTAAPASNELSVVWPPPWLAFDVLTLTDEGRMVTGGMSQGLLVAAGHALTAIRIDAIGDDINAFYRCLVALEPRATLHDECVAPCPCIADPPLSPHNAYTTITTTQQRLLLLARPLTYP